MSKPTHIIIKIEDAEKELNEGSVRNYNIINAFLFKIGKKISLSEEDIKEKVKNEYPTISEPFYDNSKNEYKIEGYKQALIDLSKH